LGILFEAITSSQNGFSSANAKGLKNLALAKDFKIYKFSFHLAMLDFKQVDFIQ
jgi:hypothetical protein